MTLCEDNCQFINYDNINKRVHCSCEIKTFIPNNNEIKFDKNKLCKNFRDINYITNIQVIKCYKIAFKINNIKSNYGFHIFCFLSFALFICTLLFYLKFYSLLIQEVYKVFFALKYKTSQGDKNELSLLNEKNQHYAHKIIGRILNNFC